MILSPILLTAWHFMNANIPWLYIFKNLANEPVL